MADLLKVNTYGRPSQGKIPMADPLKVNTYGRP